MKNQGQFDGFRSMALDENLPAMAAMLDGGFDVNTTNDAHETTFLHCCANDRFRAAKFLAGRGADVNAADHGGTTPADFAARYASRDFRDWLARAGGRGQGADGYSAPIH